MGTSLRHALLLSAIAGLLLAWAPAADAENWPGWRGPTGLGLTDEKDLPLTWGGKTNENVIWKVPLPGSAGGNRMDQNQSSPIVEQDRIFLTMSWWPAGVDQKEYPQHHVTCLQVADGKQLWDTVVPPGPWKLSDLRGGYTAPTPVTDGHRVYVLFGSAVLAALDYDGKIAWRKEITPYTFDVAIGSSPVLNGNTILLLCGMASKKDSRIVAFDKNTGEVKWEQKRPTMGFAHSTPIRIPVNGKSQMVVSASGGAPAGDAILGLDPENGKVIWWCQGAGDAATPAYGAGIVYCDSGRGGPGVAVDPTGMGDVGKTHRRWTIPQVPEGLSSPIIAGDFVYRVHEPGVLKCWKVATGDQVFSERLNGVSSWSSPLADPNGRIYLANAGKTYVIGPGSKLEVLAVNDLGDASRASAAVAGGRIFLKGQQFLYCIGKK